MLASGVPQNVVTGYEPYLTNLLGMKPRERERERKSYTCFNNFYRIGSW